MLNIFLSNKYQSGTHLQNSLLSVGVSCLTLFESCIQFSLLQRSLICLQTFPATYLPKEPCLSHRKATAIPRQAVISSSCLLPMDTYTKALMVMTLLCMLTISAYPAEFIFQCLILHFNLKQILFGFFVCLFWG